MPVPLGKKDKPTRDSMVEDLPALWLPKTTAGERIERVRGSERRGRRCWSRASEVDDGAVDDARRCFVRGHGGYCVVCVSFGRGISGKRPVSVAPRLACSCLAETAFSSPLGAKERVEACRCAG